VYTFKIESYFVVGYRKLVGIIEKEYGKKINLLKDQRASLRDKERVKFTVTGDVTVYDKKRIRIFKEHEEYDSLTSAILNDLASKEIIPKGNYFVQFGGMSVERELY